MTEQAHSPIGASSAYRWLNCPASVAASQGIADDAGPAAKEGTAAHALAELCLKDGLVSSDPYLGLKFPQDAPAADQFEATREMCKGVDEFLRHVWRKASPKSVYYFERRFEIAPGMFGRCDAAILRDGVLYVDDLKYGFDPVEVKGNRHTAVVAGKMAELCITACDNTQLPYYALGALTILDAAEQLAVTKVVLSIVQPRAPHPEGRIRTVEIDMRELDAWRRLYMWGAERTRDPNAKFYTGPHCKYCPSAGTPRCPVFETVATSAAVDAVTGVITDPAAFTPDEMGERLRKAELLRMWLKRLDAQAEEQAKAGKVPTGYKWINGRGSRNWKDAKDAAFESLMRLGKGISTIETLSVAQAEELLTTEEFAKLADLVDKKPGKLKLAPNEDKNPAVNPQDATDVFTH